ncbi:hypothetical protein AB182_03990 [Phytobacter ursingii]|uniref:Uncharacterized protein n=2 Tax=Enterobacteriaceae TaxID=543 RepID=A0AAC8TKJ4_9ENTR|nr:hypothetical protein AB182_03990 [Phytobacter ursingii]
MFFYLTFTKKDQFFSKNYLVRYKMEYYYIKITNEREAGFYAARAGINLSEIKTKDGISDFSSGNTMGFEKLFNKCLSEQIEISGGKCNHDIFARLQSACAYTVLSDNYFDWLSKNKRMTMIVYYLLRDCFNQGYKNEFIPQKTNPALDEKERTNKRRKK